MSWTSKLQKDVLGYFWSQMSDYLGFDSKMLQQMKFSKFLHAIMIDGMEHEK
jgi:hypothetical protein